MIVRLLVLFHALFVFHHVAVAAQIPGRGLAETGQLAYSNTLGTSVVSVGAGITMADDIAITGGDGCHLAGIEFDVSGATDGQGAGPFAVDFELFDNCPGSGGLPIPGTRGHVEFPNEDRYTVEFPIPEKSQIAIPQRVWLALTFNRDHAGWVGGAPALVGYSDDWYYYPFVGCESSFGGYPDYPHGSMNARIYVRGVCPEVHMAYHAKTPRRGPINPGAGVPMADDIELEGSCQMVAFEVTVRGSALYETDFRLPGAGGLPGEVIPGTARSIQHFGNFIRTLRQKVDPPISLPQSVWFTITASSTIGRTQVAGMPARIGNSNPGFAVFEAKSWQSRQFPGSLVNGALEVTILCAGPAPSGACCDMQFFGEDGHAVCREVARANCPYPAPGRALLPAWREGESCDPDPFDPPCGTAACCRADGSCVNETRNYCMPRGVSWTRGSYCDSPEIACESVCVVSEESCSLPHPTRGCIDPFCCATVCSLGSQAFCCQVAWDQNCVSQAALLCGLPPANDECYAPAEGHGARLFSPSSPGEGDTINATEDPSDPGFCCHGEGAGRHALGTVWFRFVATSTTARLRTCLSNAPASDSILQVFEAADDSTPQTACATLRSIGCNDDAALCSSSGLNSQMCLRDLTIGRTYYVMLAAKNEKSRGLYRLNINAPCSDAAPPDCGCPTGDVRWLDPPSGVVDARRPHPRNDSASLEGMASFLVQAPLGSDEVECWDLCETGGLPPNEVLGVQPLGGANYSITLKRPITPGAVTTLTLDGDPATRGVFSSHPVNINGDSVSAPADLLHLIDALNGVRFLPWGVRSGDIDRSGMLSPADILETIDLLNGLDAFGSWSGVARPDPSPCTAAP